MIPTYNSGGRVAKVVDCIKGAGEIIVVDDMSSDGSLSSLQKSKQKNVNIIRLTKKGYASGARNAGFAKAKGSNVLFVDDDVFLEKGCIKEMQKYKNYDVVFPTIDFENGVRMHPKGEGGIGLPAAFMIRKDAVKKIGELFDETFRFDFDDADLDIRCKVAGLREKHAERAKAIHILKKQQTEKLYYLYVRNMIYGIIKFGQNSCFNVRRLFSIIFVNGLLNYSWYWSYQSNHEHGLASKLKRLFVHEKITGKTRFYLVYLTVKAVLWNITNIRKTLKKRSEFMEFRKANIHQN